MKNALVLSVAAATAAIALWWWLPAEADDPAAPTNRGSLAKLMNDGNFNIAYEGYRKLALSADSDPKAVGDDLRNAITCLQNLGRVDEIDEFREAVIEVHAANWRLLWAAADSYLNVDHHGFLVAGKFERGNKRGGGEVVNAFARDRVRALQLMRQAHPQAAQDQDRSAASEFYMALARILLSNAGYSEAWRLQVLTNLDELPDLEPGWYYGVQRGGAPVAPDGTPVYYDAPRSFEEASNDGARWRWALAQAVEMSPAKLNDARWVRAHFLQSQFGVQTLAEYGPILGRAADGDEKAQTGTFALHTLEDNETIARLATGIKRFPLPDDQNYLVLFRQIVDEPATGIAEQAQEAIAREYENRRRYPQAAETWRSVIQKVGAGHEQYRKLALEQIVGNWGRFEGVGVQPAGTGATVEFRFRNGKRVEFTARPIKVASLLDDVKAYLKSNPRQLDWQKLDIGNIGYRILQSDQAKYVEKRPAATWSLDLEPRQLHFDRRISVTTPLQKAGAYLVTAEMEGGNTADIVLWVSDTVIVKKPLAGKTLYYVADAVSGKPIAKANLEFFAYRQRQVGNTNRFTIDVKNSAELTDEQGQVIKPVEEEADQFAWLITARTKPGRFAHLGFTHVWRSDYYDSQYDATKVFAITDRPVYRPNQTVKFKFWIGQAKYDQPLEASPFANQSYKVLLLNPKGDKVLEQAATTDTYGGIEGSYELPIDAQLGVYQVLIENLGGGTFRVEEYKKPEFEVTVDAPQEPVQLGEKITAKIKAAYYFGGPVTRAKVKYKVQRTSYEEQWYPLGRWDWLYGRGYWWFAYDATWHPGWHRWGCLRPIPWWWGRAPAPPEVIAEAEVEIGPEGEVAVEIDTALAKEIHGDMDHTYQITAEVVDASRRTIVGQGEVKVARQPYKVFVWVDRGHYRMGDTIDVGIAAHTLNQQPVEGTGKLTLYSIEYDEKRQPIETAVNEWDLNTSAQGQATQKLAATRAGQYRLSYLLADDKGHSIEGGYVFTVMGAGVDGRDWRFGSLELIPDRREYRPGEKVRLQVNADRAGSTVLLFVRPSNGVYLPPKVLTLAGKSTVVEVDVVPKDMPNFFVEAFTVADARLHEQTRELVVPPESRVVNVAVEPSAKEYRPGSPAEVKVTFTGPDGKPLVGALAVAIYDKAVEYISGGSNVPDIREFFWKWRRQHYSHGESNLSWFFYNLTRPNMKMMADLGIFGGTVADELSIESAHELAAGGSRARGFRAAAAEGPPAPASLTLADKSESLAKDSAALQANAQEAGQAGAPLVEPTVRTNFADTALWAGMLVTDGDGVATVSLTMPENLTTWKIRAWGMGRGTRVGQGDVEVITNKDLLVRLQAPRFFVERDEVVLTANVHNYLPDKKTVEVSLELGGDTLVPPEDLVRQVEIEPEGEARVDWRVSVGREGEAVVRMLAKSDVESDAMEMRFPVYVHGMLKLDAVAGALRPDDKDGTFTMQVPQARRPEQSRLEVRYSPTLAGAMVDALPYLVNYPYGCTEQTLSRFLPTVITHRILQDMGLDLAAIRDKQTNLNSQELGDAGERATAWKRYDINPVFDVAEVQAMVKEGVQRLTDMQLADGGWGWFSGWGEYSHPHTTAYVVHGLQLAQQNDVAVVPGVVERGVAWLKTYQDEQVRLLNNAPTKTNPYKTRADNVDALVYLVLVDAGETNDAMQDFLYRDRTHLAVYAKALLGLALEKLGQAERLQMILTNIGQFVVQDNENQTAYLRLPEDNYWWMWYGNEVEAHAYYIKLLARTEPKGVLASRLVKYLLNNRKHASRWNSTRDTAIAVEALADFLKASGESRPDMTVQIVLDGRTVHTQKVTAENLFRFDNRFVLAGADLTSGEHTIEIRRQGQGPVYYNGYLTNFTLEDHIPSAGLELKVQRKFYRLIEDDKQVAAAGSRGQSVEQRVDRFRREEISESATVTSGDLVEVELEIESKNDYEYLIFEDMKAAGFEPVEVRSGYQGNALNAYVEMRDNRVVFFVRSLARGRHSVAYRLRAEIPGSFSALPAKASAMYAPELAGNSEEIRVNIADAPAPTGVASASGG